MPNSYIHARLRTYRRCFQRRASYVNSAAARPVSLRWGVGVGVPRTDGTTVWKSTSVRSTARRSAGGEAAAESCRALTARGADGCWALAPAVPLGSHPGSRAKTASRKLALTCTNSPRNVRPLATDANALLGASEWRELGF
jgi:hypothetical protein